MTTPADSNLPPSVPPLVASTAVDQAQQKKTEAASAAGTTAQKTGDVAAAAQIKPSSEDQQLAIRYLSRPMELTHVKSEIPVGRMIASLKETPDGRYQVVLNPRQPLAKGGNATLDAMMQKGIDEAESRIKTKTYTKEEIQQFAKLESEFDKKWEADLKSTVGRVKYEAFEISTPGAFEFLGRSLLGSFIVRDNPNPEEEGSKILYYRNGTNGAVTREIWSKGENGKMSVVREYINPKLKTQVEERETTEFGSFEEALADAHMNGKIKLDQVVTKQEVEDRALALEYFKKQHPEYNNDKLVVTTYESDPNTIEISRQVKVRKTIQHWEMENQSVGTMSKQGFEDYAILQRFEKNRDKSDPRYVKYLARQEAEKQRENAAIEEAGRKRQEAAAAQPKPATGAATAAAPAPAKAQVKVQEMNAKEMLDKLGVKKGIGTPGAFVVTQVAPRSFPSLHGDQAMQKDFSIAINYCDKETGQLKKIFVAQEGKLLYVVGSDNTWKLYSATLTSYLEALAHDGIIDIDKQK